MRDVVRAYRAIIDTAEPGEIFNVASGETRLLSEMLRTLLSMVDREIEIVRDPKLVRSDDLSLIEVSIDRIERRTGWKPSIPVRQTLRDTLEYWRHRVRESGT